MTTATKNPKSPEKPHKPVKQPAIESASTTPTDAQMAALKDKYRTEMGALRKTRRVEMRDGINQKGDAAIIAVRDSLPKVVTEATGRRIKNLTIYVKGYEDAGGTYVYEFKNRLRTVRIPDVE